MHDPALLFPERSVGLHDAEEVGSGRSGMEEEREVMDLGERELGSEVGDLRILGGEFQAVIVLQGGGQRRSQTGDG
jgi:hypothetical protein